MADSDKTPATLPDELAALERSSTVRGQRSCGRWPRRSSLPRSFAPMSLHLVTGRVDPID